MDCPVMYSAIGEHRYATRPATSSSLAARCIGTARTFRSHSSPRPKTSMLHHALHIVSGTYIPKQRQPPPPLRFDLCNGAMHVPPGNSFFIVGKGGRIPSCPGHRHMSSRRR
jgi:hypothetical protein